jgi:translation initiation factor 3 subunit L
MKQMTLRIFFSTFSKHKMSNIESDQASEDFRSASEVDFYIHNDMIHIADTKVARRFSDYFIRQIHKLDEVNHLNAKLLSENTMKMAK